MLAWIGCWAVMGIALLLGFLGCGGFCDRIRCSHGILFGIVECLGLRMRCRLGLDFDAGMRVMIWLGRMEGLWNSPSLVRFGAPNWLLRLRLFLAAGLKTYYIHTYRLY